MSAEWLTSIAQRLGIEWHQDRFGGLAITGGFDKVVHVVLFFWLTVMIYRSLWRLNDRLRQPLWSGAVATLHGIVLELLQGLSTARSSDLLDGLADAVGALLSVGSIYLFEALTRRRALRS